MAVKKKKPEETEKKEETQEEEKKVEGEKKETKPVEKSKEDLKKEKKEKKKKEKISQKERPKSKKKHKKVQVWKLYTIKDGKAERKNESCQRCGLGTFLAVYENRKYCGKCGWAQIKHENVKNNSQNKA